jgi:hypothetical protein
VVVPLLDYTQRLTLGNREKLRKHLLLTLPIFTNIKQVPLTSNSMKKALALLLGFLLLSTTTIASRIIFKYQANTKRPGTEYIYTISSFPRWANGLPLTFIGYEDCPSGCIPQIFPIPLIADLGIYSSICYLLLTQIQKHKVSNPAK